jgi:hypothetical protein
MGRPIDERQLSKPFRTVAVATFRNAVSRAGSMLLKESKPAGSDLTKESEVIYWTAGNEDHWRAFRK